jgi:hypothetical protein
MSVWKAFSDGLRVGLNPDPAKPEEPESAPLPDEPVPASAADRGPGINKFVLGVVVVVVVQLLIALLVNASNRENVGNTDTASAESFIAT